MMFNTTASIAADNTRDSDPSSYLQQLQDNRAAIASIDKAIADNARERKALAASLNTLETRVSDRTSRLQELQQQSAVYSKKLKQFENRIDRLRASLAADKAALASLLRSQSKPQRQAFLKLMLSDDNPQRSARHSTYLAYLQQARLKHVEVMTQRLASVDHAQREALKSRNWLEHLSNKASKQQQQVSSEQSRAIQSLAELEKQTQKQNVRKNKLEEQNNEIETLLSELQNNSSAQSGYFEAGKGRHLWPVGGTRSIGLFARFGDKRASGKLKWNGVHIVNTPGNPVMAIADGEVVYADVLAAMGIVVVIQHGDEYLSLYGGNAEALVKPGQWVETGSTIATVGRKSGPNPAGIYLEIRQKAAPVDPEKWLDARKHIKLAKN